MSQNVKFYFGSQAKYDALSTKNPLALYFIEDTQRLYKGEVLLATGAEASAEYAGLMSVEDKAKLGALIAGEGGGITSLTPVDSSVIITDTAEGKAIGVAISSKEGNALVAVEGGLFVPAAQEVSVPEYSIEKQEIAEDGYAVSYKLKKTVDGESSYVGDVINIAKDMVLKSATLETVAEADVPYVGAVVGDPYIDMAFNDAAKSHIYVPVKGLVDTYTAGEGIEIIDGKISVKIAAESHGLVAVDGAMGMVLATAEQDGAMSKDDKAFTETEVDNKLSGKSDTGHTHSNYVPTSRTVNGKALSANITLSASDVDALPSDTDIPTALADLTADSTHRTVTDAEKATWDAKSNFSGSYNDLTNKPTIPSISGLATTTYVDEQISEIDIPVDSVNGKTGAVVLSASDVGALPSSTAIPDSLSDLASDSTHRTVTDTEKATWNAKSDFSGSYNDLTNKPTIPSIDGLATEEYVDDAVSTKVDKVSGKGLSTNDYTTTEKNKLAGIASGAEVNQNAFSNVVVGSTTIAADSETDSLTIAAGTGISVSGDATNDKVTITNSGVRSIATGTANGTISVNTNGTAANVAVKGLGSAAYTASTAYDAAGTAQTKADAALASAKTYADEKVAALVDSSPDTLNTLNELAAALGDDPNFATTIATQLGTKVDKVSGKGLSTNDYTTTEKNKLAGIATGAQVNQNAFSNIVIADTTIAADAATDTLTLVAGSNITLTPDATNDKITIAATDTTYSAAGSSLGLVKSGGDVTISSGVITVNDDSHAHVISNVDGLQDALDGKSGTGHTHSYAGSSSAGGAATSANKLNTDAGSATQPVYFSNGIPVKTTYTLGKSVPSSAVFTDTHYTAVPHAGSSSSTAAAATTNGNTYINIVENGARSGGVKIQGSGATTVTSDSNGVITISSTDNNTVYTHPTTSGNKHIPSGGSSGQILRWSADGTAAWGADNNTTYSAATTSAAGLMSAADKSKLDGIASGANAYTHPSYTARTGKPTANQTPAFGGTATVSQITSDATGHVTAATDRTITIPSTLSNGTGTAGLIKTSSTVTSASGYTACPVISGVPYYKDTNTQAVSSVNGNTGAVTVKHLWDINGQDAYMTVGSYPSSRITRAVGMDSNDKMIWCIGNKDGALDTIEHHWYNTDGSCAGSADFIDSATIHKYAPIYRPSNATTLIPASANLNTTTYLEPGTYYCTTAQHTSSTPVTNCPVPAGVGFMMTVYYPYDKSSTVATGTWLRIVRKIISHSGIEYIQMVSTTDTAGAFTYNDWRTCLTSSDTAAKAKADASGNTITSTYATKSEVNALSFFSAGTTAPTNTKLLWIDTTATTGGLKYYNGSAWVHVPVAFT